MFAEYIQNHQYHFYKYIWHVVLLVVVIVVCNNLFSGWNRKVVLYLYLFRKRLHSLLNIIVVVVVDLYSGGSVLFYSSRLAPVMSGLVFEVFRMVWRYKRTTSRGRRRD